MTSEADIQRTIFEALVWDGWLVIRVNGGGMKIDGRYVRFGYWQALGYEGGDKGISDLIAFKPHRPTLMVEVKKPGGELSAEQVQFLNAAEDAGCISVVAESVDDLEHFLDRVKL